jgi:hypothetical protein
MFSINDDLQDDQVFIGQDRAQLWFHLRTTFENWGLRGLILRLPSFPGRLPGDTLTVEAGLRGHSWFLRATAAAGQAEARLPLTVGLGWTTLLPFRYPFWDEWVLLNAVWLAGLVLPAGFWAGRTDPALGAIVMVGVVVLGLAVIPRWAEAFPSLPTEWLGASIGAAVGWAGGVYSRDHPRPPGVRET